MGNISNTHVTHKLMIYFILSRSRTIGEYFFVKDKYDKLHSMIIKREAGKLDFKPKCPMEQWKSQASAMGQYLYQLEVKAEIEGYSLDLD